MRPAAWRTRSTTTGATGARPIRDGAAFPLALRGHLFHGRHRSDRVRDHHSDPALLRATVGRRRVRAGRPAGGVLGAAGPGDPVPGPYLRPRGPRPRPRPDPPPQP